jgi:hypothetical protein
MMSALFIGTAYWYGEENYGETSQYIAMVRVFGNFRLDEKMHTLLPNIVRIAQCLSRFDCANPVEPFPSITGNHPAHQWVSEVVMAFTFLALCLASCLTYFAGFHLPITSPRLCLVLIHSRFIELISGGKDREDTWWTRRLDVEANASRYCFPALHLQCNFIPRSHQPWTLQKKVVMDSLQKSTAGHEYYCTEKSRLGASYQRTKRDINESLSSGGVPASRFSSVIFGIRDP